MVAIKRLKKEPESLANMLKICVERVGKSRHKHLVTLLGYNMVEEGDGPGQGVHLCLVYEFVGNKTLRTRLAGIYTLTIRNFFFLFIGWPFSKDAVVAFSLLK